MFVVRMLVLGIVASVALAVPTFGSLTLAHAGVKATSEKSLAAEKLSTSAVATDSEWFGPFDSQQAAYDFATAAVELLGEGASAGSDHFNSDPSGGGGGPGWYVLVSAP